MSCERSEVAKAEWRLLPPDGGDVGGALADSSASETPPSVVTPSGIRISLQWAWEDLNFRPHAYQARRVRPKSRHFAVIFTMDHVICRHLDPKCRTLPGFIDTKGLAQHAEMCRFGEEGGSQHIASVV